MTVLGSVISLRPPDTKRKKDIYLWSFGGLGVTAVALTILQTVDSSRSGARLETALETLRQTGANNARMTKENVRISNQNAALQQQLLKSNKVIADLAKTTINTVTGGGSFCFMDIAGNASMSTRSSTTPYFKVEGSSPLYDVSASITDQRKLDQFDIAHPNAPGLEVLNATRANVSLGNMSPQIVSMPGFTLRFTDPPVTQHFLIEFTARNGGWTQILRLARVDNKWVRAYRVERVANGRPVLRECIDPKFPLAEIDWRPIKNVCAVKR